MTQSIPKLPALGLAIALATLALAALPSAASASDKDCADFASQRAAQIFFLKHGGPGRDLIDSTETTTASPARTTPAPAIAGSAYRRARALSPGVSSPFTVQ